MKNIILTGMPGAGKSSMGVVLAKILNMDFLDTDLVIQKREGKPLQEIIDKFGLSYFLQAEENAVIDCNVKNTIIATGGSVIMSEKALIHLKKSGTVVYLKLSYPEIEKRINNIATRGIAFNEGETLFDMYNYRKTLYEKYADITIDCDDKTMEENIEKFIKEIKK